MAEKSKLEFQAEMCIIGYLNAAVIDYEERLQQVTALQGHFSDALQAFWSHLKFRYAMSNLPIPISVYILSLQLKADAVQNHFKLKEGTFSLHMRKILL